MNWYKYGEKEFPMTNFSLSVLGIFKDYAGRNVKPITVYSLKMEFGDNQGGTEFSVPQPDLESVDWPAQDARTRLNPAFPDVKVKRFLADHVRSLSQGLPVKKRYLLHRVGGYQIEGEQIFCTGRNIIRSAPAHESDYEIVLASIPNNLDTDPKLAEEEAVAGMLELMGLNPDAGRILVAHTLMYLMREVYANAWKSPRICVFVYGETGTLKTTYTAFMTQIYNRDDGIRDPERLNTSIPAAVAILHGLNDCTVVLDDLFPSAPTRIKGQQEETLIEITRIIGDGTPPARMKGGKLNATPPTCGAVFTGEYLYGIGSSAARILPVLQSCDIDGKKLKFFQDNPLILSTFYRNFLIWYITNYDEILDYLKAWRTVYCTMNLGIHDRLQETHFYFSSAYSLFLQYLYDNDCISDDDAQRLCRSFFNLITALVQEQDQRVKQGVSYNSDTVDYLSQIRTMYRQGDFFLADTPKSFSDNLHDGLLHNGCLCLRRKQLSKHFPNISLDTVLDSLQAQGALKSSGGCRSGQINALGGMRFYMIPLDKL